MIETTIYSSIRKILDIIKTYLMMAQNKKDLREIVELQYIDLARCLNIDLLIIMKRIEEGTFHIDEAYKEISKMEAELKRNLMKIELESQKRGPESKIKYKMVSTKIRGPLRYKGEGIKVTIPQLRRILSISPASYVDKSVFARTYFEEPKKEIYIPVPRETVKKLGWKDEQKLKLEIKRNWLILKPVRR